MTDFKDNQNPTTIFRMPSADETVPDLAAHDRLPNPTLSIVKGPHTGTTFVLDTPLITIGRDPSNNVFLNDMTVSRHHARLELTPSGDAMLEDLGSLNGTWVDGAIMNRAKLEDGSTIQIGTFRMVYHTTQSTSRISVDTSSS